MRDGYTHPCCNFDGPGSQLTEGESLRQHIHNEFYQGLRERMSKGEKIAQCRSCYEREEASGKSMRTWINERRKDIWNEGPRLRGVEVYLGNLCNLKCRGCNSSNSTKWAEDERKLGLTPHGAYRASFEIFDGLWEILDNVKFVGGEPFMSPDHERFLRQLEESGRIENVHLEYTTNGMFRVSPEVIRIWKRAKFVEIAFSIDGLRERNDFFRSGSDWRQIIENMHWFKSELAGPNVLISVHTVVSIYNVHELAEIDEWLASEFPGIHLGKDCLYDPPWLDCRNLPDAERERLAAYYSETSRTHPDAYAREQYAYVGEFLRCGSGNFETFRRESARLNSARGETHDSIHPRLRELTGE